MVKAKKKKAKKALKKSANWPLLRPPPPLTPKFSTKKKKKVAKKGSKADAAKKKKKKKKAAKVKKEASFKAWNLNDLTYFLEKVKINKAISFNTFKATERGGIRFGIEFHQSFLPCQSEEEAQAMEAGIRAVVDAAIKVQTKAISQEVAKRLGITN